MNDLNKWKKRGWWEEKDGSEKDDDESFAGMQDVHNHLLDEFILIYDYC